MGKTFTPRYVVRKADHVPGRPIPDDEPVLVIRAQDQLAEDVMRFYIERWHEAGAPDQLVTDQLDRHARELERWRLSHPELIKWADH